MEIIENGSPERSSNGLPTGWPGRLLVGILVLAVLAALVIGQVRGHRPKAKAVDTPPSPVALPALVDIGTDISIQTFDRSRDFALQTTLKNFNRTAVQVQAAAVPGRPGLARLAVAIIALGPGSTAPSYDAVVTASHTPVTLGWNEEAQLTLAGRVGCDTAMTGSDRVGILVDGVERAVTLPRLEHDRSWAQAMHQKLCRPTKRPPRLRG